MATEKELGFIADSEIEDLGFVPETSPKTPVTSRNFPRMGVPRSTSPTLGQEAYNALPFVGAEAAFRSGQQSGTDLLGNNLAGDILGALAGFGQGIGTIFNPVAKTLGFTAPVAQATGSLVAGDTAQAIKDLTGQTEVLPNLQEGQTANTLQNLLINSYNAVRRDPANTIPMIFGGVQLARAPRATVGNLATGIENLATKAVEAAKSPARTLASSGVPIATGIGNFAETVKSRGFIDKPLEDVVTKTIGIEPINGGVDTFQAAKTIILEETGKLPSRDMGLSEYTLDAAKKAKASVLDKSKDFLRSADESGLLVNEAAGVDLARDTLTQRFDLLAQEPGLIDAILDKPEFRNLKSNVKPSDTQRHLQEFNTKYQAFEDKTSPEAVAYNIVRDYLSDQNDGVIKVESGQNISPYRDWGRISDFETGLRDQVARAQNIQAGRQTPGERALPPTGLTSLVKKGAQRVGARALIPRAIEEINTGVRRGFKEIPNRQSPRLLSPEEINSLRVNFQPIQSSAPVAPALPPPNLEAIIQQRLRNSPRKTGFERAAAIQDLKSKGLLPQDYPLGPLQ